MRENYPARAIDSTGTPGTGYCTHTASEHVIGNCFIITPTAGIGSSASEGSRDKSHLMKRTAFFVAKFSGAKLLNQTQQLKVPLEKSFLPFSYSIIS